MPYNNPQDNPDIDVQAKAVLKGFNPDDHIKPMMVEWWRNTLRYIREWEERDPIKATIPLRDVLGRHIVSGRNNPETYQDLNTFLEVTPIADLPLVALELMGKTLNSLPKEVHDQLPIFIPFLKAIKTVLVDRQGLDEDTFKILFIPPHITLEEDSNSTV